MEGEIPCQGEEGKGAGKEEATPGASQLSANSGPTVVTKMHNYPIM